MRRGVLLLLVLASLLWQVVSHAAPGSAYRHGNDADHAALHWQEQAHHHHEDGSVSVDESDESRLHVQLDGAVSCCALVGSAGWSVPALSAPAPFVAQARPHTSPALEGLRRPPRTGA